MGAVIVVKARRAVPLDGTVLEGISALDTAPSTGESVPRDVEPGDDVIQRLCKPVRPPAGASHQALPRSPPCPRSWTWWKTPGRKRPPAENFITASPILHSLRHPGGPGPVSDSTAALAMGAAAAQPAFLAGTVGPPGSTGP